MPTRDPRDLADAPAAVFPPVDLVAWRRRVEKELGELDFDSELIRENREGVEIEPLYAAGSPSLPESVRPAARRWRIAEEYRMADREAMAEAIREGQRLGVELLWLGLPEPSDWLSDLIGRDPARGAGDVERLLEGVDLDRRAVVIETGREVIPSAAAWVAGAERLGYGPEDLQGAFACDPLTIRPGFAESSRALDRRCKMLADLTAWVQAEAPGMRSILVSTAHYHDAGASSVDELALAIASGVDYLRRLTAAGLDPVVVAARTFFALKVGSDVFVEIAKLRALRLLWAKVLHASGVEDHSTIVHVLGSARTSSLRDPRINLLRGGAQAFAAAVGGADSLVVTPFDEVLEPGDMAGRRTALMTQHILAEEAHLGRTADPAAGSWCVETLTDRLARSAWELFRELEAEGGMAACLEEGRVQELVRRSGTRRHRAATHLLDPMVGVSAFVDLEQQGLERPEKEEDDISSDVDLFSARMERLGELGHKADDVEDAWARMQEKEAVLAKMKAAISAKGKASGKVMRHAIEAYRLGESNAGVSLYFRTHESLLGRNEREAEEQVETCRLAEPFERLRDQSDQLLAGHRRRPMTFLARFGARGGERAAAVRQLLAAAGIESVVGGPYAADDGDAVLTSFSESSSDFAVLCADDDLYLELAERFMKPLQDAGALWVMVAGDGGEHQAALRSAGIDDFLFAGCDLVTIARFLYDDLEMEALR